MTDDRFDNRTKYDDVPPVRASRFSHTGQGHSKRALGRAKEALRAPDRAGPRAALTRRGRWRHPAPEGDAVVGRGKRQAAAHISRPVLVDTITAGDRLSSTVSRQRGDQPASGRPLPVRLL